MSRRSDPLNKVPSTVAAILAIFMFHLTLVGIVTSVGGGATITSGYAKRLNGWIRRECLDLAIVFCDRHLRHLLRSYMGYYNNGHCHGETDLRPVE